MTNEMTSESDAIYDVVLANGRVIDPETYRDGIFNVGLMGGQIVVVTEQTLRARKSSTSRA